MHRFKMISIVTIHSDLILHLQYVLRYIGLSLLVAIYMNIGICK